MAAYLRILCIIVLTATVATAAVAASCFDGSYTVFHINGIDTDPGEADINLEALRLAVGASRDGKAISYQVAYNATINRSKDMKDVFVQKASEYPNVAPETIAQGLIYNTSPNLPIELANYIKERQLWRLKTYGYTAYIDQDLANITAAIRAKTSAGSKVLLVPHSQGNLYANAAREALVSSASAPIAAERIRIFGVASAAAYVSGGDNSSYLTSGKDLVIRGLDVAYEVLPANAEPAVSFTLADTYGHNFVDIYLNPELEARAQVIAGVTAGLSTLDDACQPDLTSADFRVRVTWTGNSDLDLRVNEPTGINSPISATNPSGLGSMTQTSKTGGFEEYALESFEKTGQYIVSVRNMSAEAVNATFEAWILLIPMPEYTRTFTVPAGGTVYIMYPYHYYNGTTELGIMPI